MASEQRRRIRVARVVLQTQFQQVLLDGDDPLERRDLAEQFGEQGRLARSRGTGDEHREAAPDQCTELWNEASGEETEVGEPVESRLAHHEAADRDARVGGDAVLG